MKISTWGVIALSGVLLAGCSSNSEREKTLEMIATNRAALLASELPLEYGPLHIMRANAKGSTIEMMMVYNNSAPNAKSTQEVLTNSEKAFCNNNTIMENLTTGISYRIKMRDSRGTLLVDQLITQETCDKHKKSK